MEDLAEQLSMSKSNDIQSTLYGVLNWGITEKEKPNLKKSLGQDLDVLFAIIADKNPQNIINLMDSILDNLKYISSEKKQTLTGIYNLQQSLARIQPLPKITVEDFYHHCIKTECDRDIPFKHPNGWVIYAKPRDLMNYSNPSLYSSKDVSETKTNLIEYGNSKCIRFYLSSEKKEYSPEYFRYTTGEFWITTGLKYVDFDDCMFGELEFVFEWLQDNKP
jgi:hypothetical protein